MCQRAHPSSSLHYKTKEDLETRESHPVYKINRKVTSGKQKIHTNVHSFLFLFLHLKLGDHLFSIIVREGWHHKSLNSEGGSRYQWTNTLLLMSRQLASLILIYRLVDNTRTFVSTNMVRTSDLGNLRMREQNNTRAVPLDAVPERRTERCSPIFRPGDRFMGQPRFRYLSPGREGEQCRPQEHVFFFLIFFLKILYWKSKIFTIKSSKKAQ